MVGNKDKGFQEGRLEGKLEGRQEGKRVLLERLLTRRFGPLPDWGRGKAGAAISRTELLKRLRASLKHEGYDQTPQLECPGTWKKKKLLE